MADVHYHPPLRAALEQVDLDDVPDPSESFPWTDATTWAGGHMPAQRLKRAGFITNASRHEERTGAVDNGGFGWFRTTDELFKHARAVQEQSEHPEKIEQSDT